jgi:hypothetical protein
MPIGSGNIRIVASQSNVTYASNSSNNIVTNANVTSLYSANINLTDYLVAFEDDGRAEYVSLVATTGSGNTSGNIATTGTFSTSGVTGAQYKNQYFIIGDPNKGLFAWDGTNNIHIGSVGSIGITNPGAGYLEPPSVTISAPNDTGGIQATAVSTITTGAGGVGSINVISGGTGYTALPGVTISAPDVQGGTQAQAVATISGGLVVAVTVTVAVSVPELENEFEQSAPEPKHAPDHE